MLNLRIYIYMHICLQTRTINMEEFSTHSKGTLSRQKPSLAPRQVSHGANVVD